MNLRLSTLPSDRTVGCDLAPQTTNASVTGGICHSEEPQVNDLSLVGRARSTAKVNESHEPDSGHEEEYRRRFGGGKNVDRGQIGFALKGRSYGIGHFDAGEIVAEE